MSTSRPDHEHDDLPPAEAERVRRRDHDAAAGGRAGMRTGLAKQFKQVLDVQAKRGAKAGRPPAALPPEPDDGSSRSPKPHRHGHAERHRA